MLRAFGGCLIVYVEYRISDNGLRLNYLKVTYTTFNRLGRVISGVKFSSCCPISFRTPYPKILFA